ncbi:protocatechuate 3,4-dioxygenase subunit alpha [Mycolicibacterium mageritense DSM 44476 = CIP 104973]|uniref:Protocatechuate 3,4-dioxygenase subunit alpha n=1 Tax=Mycolicibacterium mageritense TaxID=53462 RepID=A0ABN5YBP9_MYCME|nr:protocatechuate 3,4-dioxygenase subunit alpha [Mycolicibacterium mageritense]MCC9179371.1 protocatechuate 3,4-dioxygenase subunit alpha [Mycolicibacterium mageritense]BBX35553.1 protocatechuate 3,4-dioxygenase subunit alpha [Mycolicibacterium mageritense]CDO19938.1 protocatechuate 3,4-dioxygenase subunit alpha [Mycolicibacterium mageritense DSM 44476 = CIP 104973]
MAILTATPGQTIGPFYGYALPFDRSNELVPPGFPGAIRLHGEVTDGVGTPVPDVLLEIWQADADGRVARNPGSLHRDGWTFTGFGRTGTDDAGRYSFTTVTPGVTEPGCAPFFAVTVFGRGLLNRLFTRCYVPGTWLDGDGFLASVPAERRHTLIAKPAAHGLRFDIRLQGHDETVFLRHA